MTGSKIVDARGRPLADMRVSVTDRCNFRCRYCMPAEIFGPGYRFLANKNLLSFDEIEAVVRAGVALGVRKVRLTGGEPLLRRNIDDLVALLSAIEGLEEIAMTTNGVLLSHYAERLSLAGLSRVTVSLDAIDPVVFSQMNGVDAKIDRVLKGIATAQTHGLPVKVNSVIQKGVNEGQIIPLTTYALENKIQLRFIEYMDVGETNGWESVEVLPSAEIQKVLEKEFTLTPDKRPFGAVAETCTVSQGSQELGRIGLISSVSKPFCHDCGRLRVSADGKLYGCLFASKGTSVKELLRTGATLDEVTAMLAGFWGARDDRYSELRGKVRQDKVEMSYIGG